MDIDADFWPGQRLAACLLSNRWFTSGILNKSTGLVEKSSMWRFMWRKREFYGVIWRCFARVTVRFTRLLTNSSRSSFEIPEVQHELVNIMTQLPIKSWTWERRDKFHVKVGSSQVTSFSSSQVQASYFWKLNSIFCNGRFIELDGNFKGQHGWQKSLICFWNTRCEPIYE